MESDSDTSVDIAATKCLNASIGDAFRMPFEAVDKCIVQWIKLLHALDQPGRLGWPLLSSITSDEKLSKCEKCTRRFCSEINLKRHFHVEHKVKKRDKDSAKASANTKRLALGEFWAGLSDEEKKSVLSFNDFQLKISVEEAKKMATHLSDEEIRLGFIEGSTLIEGLADLIWHTAFPLLTRVCLKAGYDLWDHLQDPDEGTDDKRLSISSDKLLSILDDASESTFLCGEAASMEGIVFGASKASAISDNNLIATTSFFLEKRLVEKMLAYNKITAEARLADAARMAEASQASLIQEADAEKARKARSAAKNRKKKEKRNAKKQTEIQVAPPTDSSGNSSDDDPPTEGSSSLPPTKGLPSSSLAPSEVQSSPAETPSTLAPPESGLIAPSLAETLSSFDLSGSEPAENAESEWHEVVRGRQKAPAKSQPGISLGPKSGGQFDVASRSQTMSSKGDAAHSEAVQGHGVRPTGPTQQAPSRVFHGDQSKGDAAHSEAVQGRGVRPTGPPPQQAPSRVFHGDQNRYPLKFGFLSKNTSTPKWTAPLRSKEIRELESRANQKPAYAYVVKNKPDAATEQKPANDEVSLNLKAIADASPPKQPQQSSSSDHHEARDQPETVIKSAKDLLLAETDSAAGAKSLEPPEGKDSEASVPVKTAQENIRTSPKTAAPKSILHGGHDIFRAKSFLMQRLKEIHGDREFKDPFPHIQSDGSCCDESTESTKVENPDNSDNTASRDSKASARGDAATRREGKEPAEHS